VVNVTFPYGRILGFLDRITFKFKFKQNVINEKFSRTAETRIILKVCDVVEAHVIQLCPYIFSTHRVHVIPVTPAVVNCLMVSQDVDASLSLFRGGQNSLMKKSNPRQRFLSQTTHLGNSLVCFCLLFPLPLLSVPCELNTCTSGPFLQYLITWQQISLTLQMEGETVSATDTTVNPIPTSILPSNSDVPS
jgi:hypothetical protein